MNEDFLVFVYGTLKSTHGNYRHYLQGKSKFLGNFETPPEYTLFDGGFPIVERQGNTSIKGEVYAVRDKHVLYDIYSLEGYSGKPTKDGGHNWYDTDKIKTPYGEAEIFVMDKGKSNRTKIVESGNWN